MTCLTFLLLERKINDINAQPKIFKRSFKFLDNPPIDFSYDIYFLLVALNNNIKIKEFPVKWYNRNAGEAKGGGSFKLKLKLTLRTIKFMFNLRESIMEIIAHKINSIKSLRKLPSKYGSEVDLRTFGSRIVLSHDPYKKGDRFEDYLENYNHGTLILNIKVWYRKRSN